MINWGIIGCGNVTEVKSGPAFSKIPGSALHAVMRRDAEKAADYAKRHNVKYWYNSAHKLITDPAVNAIYIATPPSSHEEYAIACIQAGKDVYLEKPMALNSASARMISETAKKNNVKISVAHYRRQMPLFKKIKSLLDEGYIGNILAINLVLYQDGAKPSPANWRIDVEVSGGGYFHDLAPHQLDLLYYFFKAPVVVKGLSINQSKHYNADDAVACTMLFENGAIMSGIWNFSAQPEQEKDMCEIIGTNGSIRFSIFEMKKITVNKNGKEEDIFFEPLMHVQQPMIEKVVEFFSGKGPNPCSGDDGFIVMDLIDQITRK